MFVLTILLLSLNGCGECEGKNSWEEGITEGDMLMFYKSVYLKCINPHYLGCLKIMMFLAKKEKKGKNASMLTLHCLVCNF